MKRSYLYERGCTYISGESGLEKIDGYQNNIEEILKVEEIKEETQKLLYKKRKEKDAFIENKNKIIKKDVITEAFLIILVCLIFKLVHPVILPTSPINEFFTDLILFKSPIISGVFYSLIIADLLGSAILGILERKKEVSGLEREIIYLEEFISRCDKELKELKEETKELEQVEEKGKIQEVSTKEMLMKLQEALEIYKKLGQNPKLVKDLNSSDALLNMTKSSQDSILNDITMKRTLKNNSEI